MKSLRKTVLSAVVLASAGLIAATASAGTAPTFVDLANAMCAKDGSGKITPAALVEMGWGTPADKATALGEASRQLGTGNCPGTNQGEIDKALADLIKLNPGFPQLQVAYNDQKDSGQKGETGDGKRGFYVNDSTVVGDTLVTTADGEVVSK